MATARLVFDPTFGATLALLTLIFIELVQVVIPGRFIKYLVSHYLVFVARSRSSVSLSK